MKRITLCNCLCSTSSPSSCDFASVIGISINSEQKTILQTTEQLIQCTLLGIHFWSLKYTTVIGIRKIWATFHSWPPFLSISDNPSSKNDWRDVARPWGILDFTDHRGGRSLEACQEIIKKLSYLILHIITCSIVQFLCSFLYFLLFFHKPTLYATI